MRRMCDGWHPFLCRAWAEYKVFKGKDYIGDLCGGHKADAEAFGLRVVRRARRSRGEKR